MLSWEPLEVLSFGAGTPSTSLALMSAENAIRGEPVWPMVPVYDAVIFCDLHGEPNWVYEQAAFVAQVCRRAGIPYYNWIPTCTVTLPGILETPGFQAFRSGHWLTMARKAGCRGNAPMTTKSKP